MNDILEFDRHHLWHPYTSATDPHPVIEIVSARENVLIDSDGNELVDGMASWWCAIHGYSHPKLNEAAYDQLKKMSHVMFGGITHHGAVDLARKLLEIVPKNLNRVFYADSGSVSMEVALKMALQYQQARGHTESNRFMTFRGGYHGDTFGAMSVCDPVSGMHTLFQGVLPKQSFLPRPAVPFGGDIDNVQYRNEIDAIKKAFRENERNLVGFVLEPVVQGAGGMWFYHPDYLKQVRHLCDEYDVPMIVDEIATGFGRTGKMFAVEWAEIEPDIFCAGKALTGGYMTLAATLTTDRIAEGISSGGNVFMHGPTFMANPLACAVAGASLELLEDGFWHKNVERVERKLKIGLEPCRSSENVADVRVLGAIGVVEMKEPVDTRKLQHFFVQRGVWIRPFGKLVYLMPPYGIRDDQLDRLVDAVCDVCTLRS